MVTSRHGCCVENVIFDVANIGDNAFRLYAAFALHANRTTGLSWPSLKGLASRLGVTDRTIRYRLTELIEAGAIERCVVDGRKMFRVVDFAPPELKAEAPLPESAKAEAPLPVGAEAPLPRRRKPHFRNSPPLKNPPSEQTTEQTKERSPPTSETPVAVRPRAPRTRKDYPAEFEQVWMAYPRRDEDDKEGCLTHWRTAVKSDAPEMIIASAKLWYREQAQNPYHFGLRRWLKNHIYRKDPPVYRPLEETDPGTKAAFELIAEERRRNNGHGYDQPNGEHHAEIIEGTCAHLPATAGHRH